MRTTSARLEALAPAEWRSDRREAIEVDALDIGPRHVLGGPMLVDEDQQAGI